MPGNDKRPSAGTPVSPRNTAKYTNKDGSKFITVPKGSSADVAQPQMSPVHQSADSLPEPDDASGPSSAPTVNRKKQKRREKAAAKAAAEQAANGHFSSATQNDKADNAPTGSHDDGVNDEEEDGNSNSPAPTSMVNGHSIASEPKSKKSKKKKKKNAGTDQTEDPSGDPSIGAPQSPQSRGQGMSRDKIWSTSNQEERERIKEFWLGLGEDERKSLVKVEKDAVLKKMKEQQKHTCSCTVCGRKRTAIEEELEGLYDAYYQELEQFANHGEPPPMLPGSRGYSHRPSRGLPSPYVGQPPSRGRIVEHMGDEEEEEEDDMYSDGYSDGEAEEDDDDYSDVGSPRDYDDPNDPDVTDFLTFGNSLQVKGGILTVADDLLKNDGKRFIEMMEQLAERRMAREEDARAHYPARGYAHGNGSYSHSHSQTPLPDDEFEDEEEDDEEEFGSPEEEYEDEEDPLTEEQRMEEGRRMFQIFAARMFEQRVLSAYKEKVAKERQQKLLEELDEETRRDDQQKAKKAKNAQKKKDKAAQKKQALAEEKARKDAEKAAEEAARLEAEQRKAAEQRLKAEEKRKQKEAQKKAEDEARMKKEAERQRRIHEQKEKQAEQERKAREAKERDKKLKDEQRQKEKELREQKEREAIERKEKQERDKREKEARAARAQKEAQEAREAKEKAKEDRASQRAVSQTVPAQPKRAPQQQPISIPTVLPQHHSNPAAFASPKIPVATPAISKVPTPMRQRQSSQQHDPSLASSATSQSASVPSQNPSPHPITPAHTSPGSIGPQRKGSGSLSGPHPSQSVSPQNDGTSSTGYQMPAMSMQAPPGLGQQIAPGFPSRASQDAPFGQAFRSMPGQGPNPGHTMLPPPGINGLGGRGFTPGPVPPPGFAPGFGDQSSLGQGFPLPKDAPPPTHTRQGSGSFDALPGSGTLPFGRPAPIGRPGSIGQGRTNHDRDDETKHLGSSVLVEEDEQADLNLGGLRHQGPAQRGGFGSNPFIENVFPMVPHNPWAPSGGNAPQPFPGPPGFSNPGWGPTGGAPGGFTVGSPGSGIAPFRQTSQPRHVAVRQMLSQTCRDMANTGSSDPEGYIELGVLKSQLDSHYGDASLTAKDLLDLCDTEGNASNGGGSFDVKQGRSGHDMIRWMPDPSDGMTPQYRAVGAPGEIGSPLPVQAVPRGL